MKPRTKRILQFAGPSNVISWKYYFMRSVAYPYQHFIARQDEIEEATTEGIYRVTTRGKCLAFLIFSSDDRTSLVKQGREFLKYQRLRKSTDRSVECQTTPVEETDRAIRHTNVVSDLFPEDGGPSGRERTPPTQLASDHSHGVGEGEGKTSPDWPSLLQSPDACDTVWEPQRADVSEAHPAILTLGTSCSTTQSPSALDRSHDVGEGEVETSPLLSRGGDAVDEVGSILEDDEVNRSDKKKKLGRPQHCCMFCKKVVTHFSNHIKKQHPEEDRVKQYVNSRSVKEKTQRMKEIIHEGDAWYNARNIQSPIPLKRAANPKPRIKCSHCEMFLSAKHVPSHIRHHHPGQQAIKTGIVKAALAQPVAVLAEVAMNGSVMQFTKTIRSHERRDLLVADRYLILHANSIFQNAFDEKKIVAARSTITIVLRIVLEMMKIDESLKTSVDCVSNLSFLTFITAIANMCGRCAQNFKKSSVVNMYGQAFKKFAKAVEAFLICDDRIEKSTHVTRFLQLFNNRFSVEVGSVAKQQYEISSASRKEEIPLMEDVVKLNDHIVSVISNATSALKKEFTVQAYTQLVNSLFLRWWVFNRRRVAEIEYLTIDHWETAVELDPNSEAYHLLSTSEQMMSSSFKRLSICGKTGRMVSLLVHNSDFDAVKEMLNHRSNAQIPASNRFLFTTGIGRVNGSAVMRSYAEKCGATTPRLLRGTLLRRHAAVCAQYINLGTEDLRQLSQALGHSVRTHLEHYRKPEAALHLGRVSILMCALNNGTISKYKNLTLDEIDISELNEADKEEAEQVLQHPQRPVASTQPTPPLVNSPMPSTSQGHMKTPSESAASNFSTRKRKGQGKDVWIPLLGDSSEESDGSPCTPPISPKKRQRRSAPKRRWETPEKKALKAHFGVSLFSPSRKIPTLPQISEAINNFNCLKKRTPEQVHAFIHNTRKMNKRTR